MTNSKILMGAGALVLTAAGVVAGRASTKFANAPGLYYVKASVCTQITSAINTAKLTTGGASETQATIRTSTLVSPGTVALWADNACSKAVHFKF